jgi:hypothetical protein
MIINRFVESNSGKSILSLFQALPTDLYSSNTLFLSRKKSTAIKMKKMLFFSFILVIIIGFLVIAGFFSLAPDGVVAGFVVCDNFIFASRSIPLLTLVFVCFFFF